MSLISSIQLASNALRAADIGIQVVGQNISNANTPGYIREEVVFSAAPTQRRGNILLGLGVQVDAVVQKVDRFLVNRLRAATSDRLNGDTQEQTYLELERLVGELSDTDLSTSMTSFFNSINEVLNQPASLSIRNLAALQGKTLADDIRRLADRVTDVRIDLNNRIKQVGDDINRLTEAIRDLNVQIAQVEGGDSTQSDAVGLRDQRFVALSELASLIGIRVDEQPSGSVTISINGTFLVADGVRREVKVVQESIGGLVLADIRLADTDQTLSNNSGALSGLVTSRDTILGGFLQDLDNFAQTLIFEFNKVFTSGQGLSGYQSITGEFAVDDVSADLDAAGLAFTPINGSFQVQVRDKQTGLTQTTDVFIDLNGLDNNDTTLTSLAAKLTAIDGITATVTPQRQLSITADSSEQEFAFAADTSGVLAALGMNTFFVGTTARTIAVNQAVVTDAGKFSASRSGIGADSDNAVELAGFLDRSLETNNNESISILYNRLVGNMTQAASASRAVAEGFRIFEDTLNGQHLAISGVSLDEETIRLMAFQQAFQAAARYISTLSELMDVLVNL